jgi:hypothetical protein
MKNHTKFSPTMGKFIIETPNQLWGGYSYDSAYPVSLYQRGESRYAKLHQFTDLAIAKEVLYTLSAQRGGAKLKIYQLADDGQRVEVAV